MPEVVETLPQAPPLVTTQAPTPGISPAQVAAPYAELGNAFDAVAGGIDDAAVRLAHDQAQGAVTRDPDGNLQVEPMPLMFGRAAVEYRRTAAQTYLAQLDPEIKNKVTEAAAQYEGKPQDFQAWGQNYVESLAGKQPTDDLQNAVRGVASRYVGETANGIIMRQAHRDLASSQDAISTQQQSIENELVALKRGGMADDAPEVQARTADWLRLQNDRRANPAYGYSEAQAAYDREQFFGELGGAQYLHTVTAIANDTSTDENGNPKGGIDNALKFADSILTDPSLNLMLQQRQKFWVEASTELRALKTDQREARRDARDNAQGLLLQSATGAPVDADDVNRAADDMRKAGNVAGAARFQASFINKPLNDAFGMQPLPEMSRQLLTLDGASVATSPAEMALIQRESGGNPAVVNKQGYAGLYQFGAPLLSDLGLYKPGANESLADWSKTPSTAPGKWSGTFNIPGYPDVKTLHDFLLSPAAQKAAYTAHVANMDQQIAANGLDKYIGQTVGGVPITQDGLRAMIHLAGPEGAKSTLESGGAINPADANGTTALDYAKLGFHPPLMANPANVAWLQANHSRELDSAVAKQWQAITRDYNEKKIVPNDQTFNDLADAARIAGDAGLLRQMAADRDHMQAAGDLAAAPLPVQHAVITGLQAQGAAGNLSPGHAGDLKDFEQRYAAVTKGLDENPIAFAAVNSRGRFDVPPPLDLSSPDKLAAGLQQRAAIARWAAQQWQVPPRSALDAADLQQVKAVLASPDPNVKAQVYGAIATLPPDVRGATLQKIGGNDLHSLAEASAGSMLRDDRDTALSIFRGLSLIEGGGKKEGAVAARQFDASAQDEKSFAGDMATEFPATVFTVPSRTNLTGDYATTALMVRARYADLAAQAGDTQYSKGRLAQAVDDVTGGLLAWNGARLIAPSRGMAQWQFDNIMAGVTDRDLDGVTTLNGAPITADALHNARLEGVAQGRYLVNFGSPGGKPIYAMRSANTEMPAPFVLDLRGRTASGNRPFQPPQLGIAP